MAKENLSGTPGSKTSVTDLSIITANQNKGAICVLAALKRGRRGEFYKIGNDVIKRRWLGGLIDGNDDSLLLKLALEAGALLYVGRLFHFTDIDDISTAEGDKAQGVISDNIAEVLATGSIEITGGSSDPGTNQVTAITVNAVDILGTAVNWATSNDDTASAVAAQITSNTSSPNYTATAVGNKVIISAVAGSGTTPNGFVVAGTVGGDVTVGNAVNMSGGIDAGAINITFEAEDVGSGYNTTTVETAAAKSKKTGYVDIFVQLPDSDKQNILYDVNINAITSADIEKLNARLLGVEAGVQVASITGQIPVGSATLINGSQDLTLIDTNDYIGSITAGNGLHIFDPIKDSMRIYNLNKAVPEVDQAFIDYCAARKDMRAKVRTPLGLSVSGVANYRNGEGAYSHSPIDSFYGSMFYSDAEITDPSDVNIKNKSITALAFDLASRSKKDRQSGEWFNNSGAQSPFPFSKINKVPINFYSPAYASLYDDIYEGGVNAIVNHDTYGVVPWGNRSLLRDATSLLSKDNIADMVVYISRVLKSLASGKNFAPNDFIMFNELYRNVRPFFVDLVNGRAIQGDDTPLKGEGTWWHWFGDQFAKTPADLTFNESSDIDVGKYRTRFAFKPIGANEYIAIDIAPADSATILNVQILQTL